MSDEMSLILLALTGLVLVMGAVSVLALQVFRYRCAIIKLQEEMAEVLDELTRPRSSWTAAGRVVRRSPR